MFSLPGAETGESLADAICCDAQFRVGYAEPNGLYAFDPVNLFGSINPKGTTVFYDSVCGLPVYVAPIGRSFEAWQNETAEHGWPSFRPAEFVTANIFTKGNLAFSKCGSYLGSVLPDSKGMRHCIDLSCISGSP